MKKSSSLTPKKCKNIAHVIWFIAMGLALTMDVKLFVILCLIRLASFLDSLGLNLLLADCIFDEGDKK